MEKKRKVTKSETDIAYEVLKQRKSPMHYKELIGAVLEQMGLDPTNPGNRLVQIHTEINLDSRFAFLGKGLWGLTAWSPKQNRPVAAADGPKERSYQPKPSDYLWEEDSEDQDDEEDLLVPDDEYEDADELDAPADNDEATDDDSDDDEDSPPSCMRVFRP